MIKRSLLFLLAVVLILVIVVLVNTFRFNSIQTHYETKAAPELSEKAKKNLTEAIGYKTISYGDSSKLDSSQFLGFHLFLKTTYPLVHQKLSQEQILKYSLLYKWEGKNSSLNPIVLMAHQDVVPIEEASKNMWTVDPFAGTIKDDFIWGRGTTDDKINLISILEATEKLLGENFQPERTIYFAFGHDEEMGGYGARAIAALLKSRNIKADLILDEGGIITLDKVPGMNKPVALLGTSEKGYLSLQLSVEKNGGHSSMPEKETSIDILTKAIVKLREKPFEARFSPSTQGFIKYLGPEMPFTNKMAFANIWLFKPMVIGIYEKSGAGNAMIRTTAVPTIIDAGIKDNVVPTMATATVNFRLLPGDSSSLIIRKVKEIINDERVQINSETSFVSEPSAVTAEDSYAFKKVDELIKKSYSGITTSPFLMIGGTDSRYFGEVSDGIIKFSPMIDPIGFHGIDERVSLKSYQGAIWFFEQLLREAK
ncbi:MAG TPA: M20 family peptidase [Cyclobacteriaceae bacterium]